MKATNEVNKDGDLGFHAGLPSDINKYSEGAPTLPEL